VHPLRTLSRSSRAKQRALSRLQVIAQLMILALQVQIPKPVVRVEGEQFLAALSSVR
jgi:hypothetical protein